MPLKTSLVLVATASVDSYDDAAVSCPRPSECASLFLDA